MPSELNPLTANWTATAISKIPQSWGFRVRLLLLVPHHSGLSLAEVEEILTREARQHN